MRDWIKDRNGNVLGSTLYTPQSDRTTLQAPNGTVLGYSQHGKAFDRNGNLLGNAALLGTLIPPKR